MGEGEDTEQEDGAEEPSDMGGMESEGMETEEEDDLPEPLSQESASAINAFIFGEPTQSQPQPPQPTLYNNLDPEEILPATEGMDENEYDDPQMPPDYE